MINYLFGFYIMDDAKIGIEICLGGQVNHLNAYFLFIDVFELGIEILKDDMFFISIPGFFDN